MERISWRLGSCLGAAVLGLGAGTPAAFANCNVIPGTVNSFRGGIGSVDRPFAMPGDLVELTIRPEVCDARSTGVQDWTGNGSIDANDFVVTVLFEPPNGGAKNAVVVASSCAAVAPKLSTCNAQLGGGSATCVEATGVDLVPIPSSIASKLRFRFPDTDDRVGTPSDDRTLAGPATIAVTASTAALPCSLATTRCADATGLVACVDELYAIDGTCTTTPAEIDASFGSFTALPPPNNYQTVCTTQAGSPCTGGAPEVRVTTDKSGDLLIPWDYRGVLVRLDDVPIPRLVRASTSFDAFAGGILDPIQIPSDAFLRSFSPEGHRLPPIFTPLADPNAVGQATLFGSVDAPLGVMRIARQACVGGANMGDACTTAAHCPGSTCSAPIFELRDRFDAGVGPVVVPNSQYTADAQSPVPIDGLSQTADVFAFTTSEALIGRDVNGDGDQTDPVVTIRNHHTGQVEPIGVAGSEGRAATRIHELPFTYPAVATENDVVAFLEPEPLQGNLDATGDGDKADTVLRVFRASGGATNLIPSLNACGEADPQINGRSLVVSDGFVFFRRRESDCARHVNQLVGIQTNGQQPIDPAGSRAGDVRVRGIGSDGQRVLLGTAHAGFAPGKTREWQDGQHVYPFEDVFVRDRTLASTEWASKNRLGPIAQPDSWPEAAFLAGPQDLIVFFDSYAVYAGTGAPTNMDNIYGYQRDTAIMYWMNPAPATSFPNFGARLALPGPSVSPDGRFLLVDSLSTNMVPNQPPPYGEHLFVFDRLFGVTEMVDVNDAGQPTNYFVGNAAMSADGRFVVFDGASEDLFSDPAQLQQVQQNPSLTLQAFVRDRKAGTTEVASVSTNGDLGGSTCRPNGTATKPWGISADGRFVVFSSAACDLVPGDTDGTVDVFVRDRLRKTTERVSVASDGTPLGGYAPRISANGRAVAFRSDGYYLYDRITGITDRLTKRADGSPATITPEGELDADATTFAFTGYETGIVANDANPSADAFIRIPDPTDTANDLNNEGDLRDTVLSVLDTNTDPPTLYGQVGIAGKTAVAVNMAAFLGPEKGYGPGFDLNQDGDLDDDGVLLHFAPSTTLTFNLSRAASDVALSPTWLAVATSEAKHFGQDLNGDGDASDQVLAVMRPSEAGFAPGAWVNVGQSVSGPIAIAGSRVAFLTSEADQGNTDLNGDGDALDQALQIYDAETASLANTGQAAEEFVLGDQVVAFRTLESAQGPNGGTDLNGDGDKNDAVLQVYDLASALVYSSGFAATPCKLEACDPRVPYRVSGRAVSFLVLEQQQGGQDLNNDGDAGDVLLKVYSATAVAPAQTIAAVSAGVCTTTGVACASDADCGGGSCYVPPGRCDLDLGTACNPNETSCGAGQYCKPVAPDTGTCHQRLNACKGDAECATPAICTEDAQQIQRLVGPLATTPASNPGDQVLPSAGICLESTGTTCASSTDCAAGEFCRGGACQHEHGACRTVADCAAGACALDLTTATAADRDGDGLADPIDDCPDDTNSDQIDTDQDGIGNACDRTTCGNHVLEADELCDDGNLANGDGCSTTCHTEMPACSDGIDNDGDGRIDNPNDPGCATTLGVSESPLCQDGVDNDSDGKIDFDGGAVANHGVPLAAPDPQCATPTRSESPPTCGLGAELALVLLALRARRGRRCATAPQDR